MARIKSKMIDDIPASKVIETPEKRFVTDLHLQILENATLPKVTSVSYSDTEVRESIATVNAQITEINDKIQAFNENIAGIVNSILALSVKYDIKQTITFNTTGNCLIDSLADNSNILTMRNCSYDDFADVIK